jgi:hypothetical protein
VPARLRRCAGLGRSWPRRRRFQPVRRNAESKERGGPLSTGAKGAPRSRRFATSSPRSRRRKSAEGSSSSAAKIAVVLPNVTEADRRALLASFVDRLGPSCLEEGARYEADPLSLKPSVWERGFYRTDDISETGGG